MGEYVDIEFNSYLIKYFFWKSLNYLLNKSDQDLGSWFVYVNKVFRVLLF